jgi:glycosyltransferase involved in cell wall biosynthesis
MLDLLLVKRVRSMSKTRLLIVDPIPFHGGSKIATQSILDDIGHYLDVTILSAAPESWSNCNADIHKLVEPAFLRNCSHGILYLLKHLLILINILVLKLRKGGFDRYIGASIPGSDISLYLGRYFLSGKTIQFVHGPVPPSRISAKAMLNADRVFYLKSSKESMQECLDLLDFKSIDIELNRRFTPFVNGLNPSKWPTQAKPMNGVKIFWAASLLKWKGLEILSQALAMFDGGQQPVTRICYIQPADKILEVSSLPPQNEWVKCYETPENFDEIRADSNVFISTSMQEPFGLSILEAMAAGHTLIIPRDGAYWDQELVEGRDCLKYEPQNARSLYEQIQRLLSDLTLHQTLQEASLRIAKNYQSKSVYASIHQELLS